MATIRRKKSEPFAIVQKDPGPWPQVLINWLATLAVIIVFGLIMLFSASYTTGYLRMGDSFYYIKSQVFCLGLGLAVMLLFSRIDHRFLRRMVGPGYVVCIVMLIAVLFSCLLYTSDAAAEEDSVALCGRRIIKTEQKISNRLTSQAKTQP